MPRRERGIALFMVLWVLTLLSVIVAEFCASMRAEINITRNFKEGAQAHYLARAGVNLGIANLLDRTRHPSLDGQSASSGDGVSGRASREISFGSGTIRLEILNEAGKININRAGADLIRQSLSPFDLDESEKDILVDSILDWRDKDGFHRLNGAEADYYRRLDPPYEPADGDFESVEDLLRVRGMTPEIFRGGYRDMVTLYPKTEPEEKFLEAENRNPLRPPKKWYTLDENRVNLNSAPAEVLLALPGITQDGVDAVLAYRAGGSFKNIAELSALLGGDAFQEASPFLTLEESPFHRIESAATLPNTATRSTASALVEIGGRIQGGYRIVRWRDYD